MRLDRVLILLEDNKQFVPRNNYVATSTINNKLKANGIDAEVKPNAGDKIKYDGGEGKVPLECKKDAKHSLKNKGRLTFDNLSKRFKSEKPKDKIVCNNCADEQGIALSGTGSGELDLIEDLHKMLQRLLGANRDVDYTIHGGNSGKVKSKYLTQNSLDKGKPRKLDYDIYIEDKKDGSKNIAINVDGPSHNIHNKEVIADDGIRAAENFKNNGNFTVAPHFKKGSAEYNQVLKSIEEYIRNVYKLWTNPIESKKMRNIANRVGTDSEYYNNIRKEKEQKLEQHETEVNQRAVQGQLNKLVLALLDNVGKRNLNYDGIKEKNLIDFLTDNNKAIESFSKNREEWQQLLSTNKNQTRQWMAKYQGKGEALNNPNYLKLFENKNNPS